MDKEKLAAIARAHATLDKLSECGTEAAIRAFIDSHFYLLHHDLKGNWEGPVANENGWTP
jgi:hypothetical protein